MKLSQGVPRKPHILNLHGSADAITGQELTLLEFIRSLKGDAVHWILLPSGGRFADLLRQQNCNVIIQALARFRKQNPIPFLLSIGKLTKIIREHEIDLLHACGAYPNQHAALAARLTGCRSICSLHTTAYEAEELRTNLLFLTHRVIGVSEAVSEIARKVVRDSRVTTCYVGVDCDVFLSADGRNVRQEFGIAEDAIVVGQIGQVIEKKGIRELIAAADVLCKQYPQLQFLVVGDDPRKTGCKEEIERTIRILGLERQVILTGFRTDLPRLYAAIDILALPSYAEGLPRVLLEAMAAGKPIVATNIPGIQEVVQDGKTGKLVPPGDVPKLTEALTELIQSAEVRLAMGRAAYVRAKTEFDIQLCFKRIRREFLGQLNIW